MTTENSGISRRTLVKGAAWSMPVIAVAAATPLAAASTTNASVAWTGTETGLLALSVLDTATVITAQALMTVPDEYTITNGPGAINEPATVTIQVGRPSGITLSTGTRRGFGVGSVDGIDTTSGERQVDYQSGIAGDYGFPTTTWTGSRNVSVASDGTLAIPVVFGLVGTSTSIIGLDLLASFPVTLTVAFADGSSYTDSSTVSVPAGAAVL